MAGKMGKGIKKNVNISDIEFDEDLYPRTRPNWLTIVDYKESMTTGAAFPPIVLATYKGKLCLVDGKHRLEANKQLGKKKISAIIYTGWSRQKIFQEAVKFNISHGLSLSPFEKRRIAKKLLEMRMKKQDVSKLIQVSMDKFDYFIGSRMTNAVTGSDVGESDIENAYATGEIIVKSSLKHLAGGTVQGDINKIQRNYFARSQEELLKQLISLLETKTIDTEDEHTMKLLARVKTLLRKYKF